MVIPLTPPSFRVETRDAITFPSYVDSVYLNAPNHVQLEVGTGAAVSISSTGWEDVVTWNPWTTMEACYKVVLFKLAAS